VRLWWEVAVRGCRRHAAYRAATFAGVFTNTVFGFIQAYVFLAVFREQPHIGSFDSTDAVTFTFVTQGFLAMVAVFHWADIAERIRSGDVVTDLYRPIDFQAYWLAQDMGRAAFQLVFRGVPPFLVGALVFDLRIPASTGTWLAFLVSATLAVVASFGVRFLVNLAAFWLLDVQGVLQLTMAVWLFFSGILVPLVLFPAWLETVARALPFAAMVQVPVEVFLGKHQGLDLLGALGGQLVWGLVLLGVGRLALAAAVRRVVVQGG
jgi:ABC-2 type transport system permease protein